MFSSRADLQLTCIKGLLNLLFSLSLIFFYSFSDDIAEQQPLCTQSLTENDVKKFSHAIEELYFFEFVIGMVSLFS